MKKQKSKSGLLESLDKDAILYMENLEKRVDRVEMNVFAKNKQKPDKKKEVTFLMKQILARNISTLGLTKRVYNSLRINGVNTVGEIANAGREKVEGFRRMGPKGYIEVRNLMDELKVDWV